MSKGSGTLPDSELALLLAEVKISDKTGLVRHLKGDEIKRVLNTRKINLEWFIKHYQDIANSASKDCDRLAASDRLWEILQLGALQDGGMVEAQKRKVTPKSQRPVTDTIDPFRDAEKRNNKKMKLVQEVA